MISGAGSSVSLDLEFRQAAATNNIGKLQEIYSLNPNLLNSTGPGTGYAAIHQAAAKGKLAAAQWLLGRDADYLLEGRDGLNAMNIALNNNHIDIFAAFYNHLHKHNTLLADFSNRTTHYVNKPLLISCQDSQSVLTQLNTQPGFIFSNYQAIVLHELSDTALAIPSGIAIEDVSLKKNDLLYEVTDQQKTHPDFIRFQNQQAAHQIARMAEKYQGGIVVLINGPLAPILAELNVLFPNLEKAFEQYALTDPADALAEQLALLELEDKLSHTNVDQIRQQARESALQLFQWSDIELFKLKLNTAIDESNKFRNSSIKEQEKIAKLLNSITASSSEMSDVNLFEFEVMGDLLKQKGEQSSFSNMKLVAKNYFDILARPHTDKELNAARANVISGYEPLFLNVAANPIKQHPTSFALLIIFYLAVKGDLFSLRTNSLSGEMLSSKLETEFQVANLLICGSKKGSDPDIFVSEIMKNVIKRLHAQMYVSNINFPLKAEYEHYVKLKNLSSRKRQVPTYIEFLSVWDDLMPGEAVGGLFEKAIRIREGLQSRTQFLFMIAPNHCALVDINWDQHDDCFKIIMLDSTNLGLLGTIAKKLSKELSKHGFASRYLICPLSVQKDPKSCAFYSLIMASHVSYLSFDELNKHPEVQPKGHSQFGESNVSFPGLKWLSITAFGEKLILMGQSSNEMRENLRKLYNNNDKKVTNTLNKWKAWYAFPGSTASAGVDYIGYRRQSIYHKCVGTRPSYTTRQILEATNTDDTGAALRQLAAGAGPGYMLTQLLTQVSSSVINEAGASSGKTALHFAYQFNRLGRANRLIAQGANQELKDRNGLTPRECLKRTP